MSRRNSNGNGRSVAAVAYYRMSSDKQEASIPEQREAVERFAADNGYRILREYIDEGISGDATEKRLDFQRMVADAQSVGDFKAILAWDSDRVGRFDSIEAGFWIHPLRQFGIHLATVAEGVIRWDDFASRMLYSIKQEGKHQFLRDLSCNTLRGRVAAAKRGDWLAPPPLGYIIADKRLALGNPQDVALVRQMFCDYLSGKSLRAVAVVLNAAGHRTQRGNHYKGETVRFILTNPAYIGTYLWSEHRSGKYHVYRDGAISEDAGRGVNTDAIVIEDNHPAVIDKATFDAVQGRLTARKTVTTPHAEGGDFVLTGILKCGKCGGPMYGRRPKDGYVRYRCHNHTETASCDLNSVQQDEILDGVLGAIEERFQQPKTVERLRVMLRNKLTARIKSVDPATLRRQLAKVDRDLSKARRNMALADGDDLRRDYEHVVRELRQEHDRLAASLKDAQQSRGRTIAEHDERIEKAINMLSRLRDAIDKAPTATSRELLRMAVRKVRTWSQRKGRYYHFERGEVHLRQDMWVPADVDLSGSYRKTR